MRLFALVLLVLLAAPLTFAADGVPAWKKTLEMSDGRTFVTDGAMTIDAALAKPAELPKDVLPQASSKIMEKFMAAELPNEYAIGELERAESGKYRAPNGLILSALYVDFLRSVLADGTLRLRMKGDLEPVVVLSSGKAVGLVMAMKR